VLAAALAASLAGCEVFAPETTASPTASPLLSGIRGIVLLGPTCEGATRSSPCVEPYVATLVILDAEGEIAGQVTSDAQGRFELALPPGIYTIAPVPPEGGALFPVGRPVPVVVGDGEYTEVAVDYDTGIR
jgi:hypothetical protein